VVNFKVGDRVWYWQRRVGSGLSRRVYGTIRQTDGTHARVRRDDLDSAIPVITVEVKRLNHADDTVGQQ